jgi:N6-L-threonylcarbamoyladenine synthase
MAKRAVLLGFDTSNYMTSVCVMDAHSGECLEDHRRLLQVKRGEKGLQQSAALFQHVRHLPLLMKEIKFWGHWRIVGIGVSTRPRPQEGSYMPVFLTGQAVAQSLALAHQVPLFETSHQEGHLSAGEGMIETDKGRYPSPLPEEFLAIHLSGGTSELLRARRQPHGYAIDLLGGTKDLHAGQFVDRVGVALGLPFPAGAHLERMARTSDTGHSREKLLLPSYVNGYNFSFSGPTTAALRHIENGSYSPKTIARAVEQCIAKTLEKVLVKAKQVTGLEHILIVGGVASNQYIRGRLQRRLEHPIVGARLFFADPRFSGDNAYGVARLAGLQYRNTNIKWIY